MFLSIPDNLITGSINFFGSKSFKLFLNSLFFCSLKSRIIRFSNFSAVRAGFKFMLNSICPLFSKSSTFLYLNKCAEPLKIIGPETPQCVNNISPKSSYIVLFFCVSINFIDTFIKLSPCNSLHNSKSSFLAVNGIKDGFIFVIVCPNSLASSYPSPVEPVTG